MFRALSEAVQRTATKAHLVLAGWANSPSLLKAFENGAAQFGPGVRTTIVDGTRTENRMAVWHAADIFTSLSDNIQETFGLVIVEAMASGLPVVATDWNGYRDLVEDSETGFLVPTWMVPGATSDVTIQLLMGEVDYDHFLARSNQSVAVDTAAAADAFARLLVDESLRRRFGVAGRLRAEKLFSWSQVINAYRDIWQQQAASLRDVAASADAAAPSFTHPAAYPPPEHAFAGYPTSWLTDQQPIAAAPDAVDRLPNLMDTPLTNYEFGVRIHDPKLLQSVLHTASGSVSLGELRDALVRDGATNTTASATLAWMLKYDLLRRAT
jgi:hypothetical protein